MTKVSVLWWVQVNIMTKVSVLWWAQVDCMTKVRQWWVQVDIMTKVCLVVSTGWQYDKGECLVVSTGWQYDKGESVVSTGWQYDKGVSCGEYRLTSWQRCVLLWVQVDSMRKVSQWWVQADMAKVSQWWVQVDMTKVSVLWWIQVDIMTIFIHLLDGEYVGVQDVMRSSWNLIFCTRTSRQSYTWCCGRKGLLCKQWQLLKFVRFQTGAKTTGMHSKHRIVWRLVD